MVKLKKRENTNIPSPLESTDSFKSLLYGMVTVTVVLSLILSSVLLLSKRQKPVSTETRGVKTESTSQKAKEKFNGNSYTVKAGEGLWDVAVSVYGDGFRWIDIAQANNLSSPDSITEGMVLKIPNK